jgi:three-Cys-motif partner protein
MPLVDGKGTSVCTATKLRHLNDTLQMHTTLVAGIARRQEWANRKYVYFDLYSGDGVNHVNGREIAGSPVIAARQITRAKIDASGFCFEKDARNAQSLRERLIIRPDFEVVEGDHADTICSVMERFARSEDKRKRFGVVFADPNGTRLPVEVLQCIYESDPSFDTVDCLAYVSATNYKRTRGAFGEKGWNPILQDLQAVGKKHIHLRVPEDKHQWTMALLTNWDAFPELTTHGFYRIESERGREIVEVLSKTGSELEEQGWKRPQWMDAAKNTFRQARNQDFLAPIAVQQAMEI